MANAIAHRGPDSHGIWSDAAAGIGLAHRRLAIVDLSPAGHQPMQSNTRRYMLVFNGEIYNHLVLRDELERQGKSPAWRGHSDTETLLAAIDAWGLEQTLLQCVGMFAIALWDKQTASLTLARDRLGEKPLYYGWQGQGETAVFLFGSELKALRSHPEFKKNIDRDALALYFRHNYIPAPHSIYESVSKLEPGSILTISSTIQNPKPSYYWSALKVATDAQQSRQLVWLPDEAVNGLENILSQAVGQQMVADVPLGAFLSGGIDSSIIVALMQKQSSKPVKTFTIGFNEKEYDEAKHAHAVAQHLGTDHTELYITPKQAMTLIPSLPTIYDEPFSDSSQIPTYLVSQLARGKVTVSLSGDGGDELFSGYTRYKFASYLWKKISRIPRPARRLIAQAITSFSPEAWTRLGRYLPVDRLGDRLGDQMHKGANVLASASVEELYRGLVSHWMDPSQLVIGSREPETKLTEATHDLDKLSDVERMMLLDLITYLPGDILTKVDRAAMAVTLETRVPMLDHRVVEFAWGLPQGLKQRDGIGKWVLRQLLHRYVPESMIDRPKMGFGVPIDQWLRGPLRDWAESLLDEKLLRQQGYLEAGLIRSRWHEHLNGSRNWAYLLWDVLMFQAWLEHQ